MSVSEVVEAAERVVAAVLDDELDRELLRQLARLVDVLHDLNAVAAGEQLTAEQRVELGAVLWAVDEVADLVEQGNPLTLKRQPRGQVDDR